MASPFDIPDVIDEDDDSPAAPAVGGDGLDIPDVVEDGSDATPANGQPREWWEDLGLGAVDGLTLNNAAELGHVGEGIGNTLADVAEGVWGTHEIDGVAPTKTGESDGGWDDLYELARESVPGKIGHGAGLLTTGAAMAGLAPVSVGGQVAAGALSGALSSGGDSGYDPAATAAGAGTGAALGGAGGALGKGADAIRRWLGGSAPAATSQMALPGMAPKAATNAERLAEKLALSLDDVTRPAAASSKIVGQGVLRAAQSPLGSGDVPRSLGGALAASGPQTLAPMLGASKASAQDARMVTDSRPFTEVPLRKPGPWQVDVGDAQLQQINPVIGEAQMLPPLRAEIGEAEIREKAYAGQPAMVYSMKTVLSSGDSGLPPAAQRDLTSALLAGDEGKIDAINFKLQQRWPEYAKRLQDQLKALSEESP